MTRKYKKALPYEVDMIVKNVLRDYPRREYLIKNKLVAEETLTYMQSINDCIDNAIKGVEVGIQQAMFYDMVYGRGYDSSIINFGICKNSYYYRRNNVKKAIAKAMRLI